MDKLLQNRKILFYKLCFLCDGYRVSRESDVSEFWGPQTVISHSNMLKHFIQSRMNNTRRSSDMPRISEVVTWTYTVADNTEIGRHNKWRKNDPGQFQ